MTNFTSALVESGSGARKERFLESLLPKLVLAPTTVCVLIFVYGFILWTAWISFTNSRLLPQYDLVGFIQYIKLYSNDRRWLADSLEAGGKSSLSSATWRSRSQKDL